MDEFVPGGPAHRIVPADGVRRRSMATQRLALPAADAICGRAHVSNGWCAFRNGAGRAATLFANDCRPGAARLGNSATASRRWEADGVRKIDFSGNICPIARQRSARSATGGRCSSSVTRSPACASVNSREAWAAPRHPERPTVQTGGTRLAAPGARVGRRRISGVRLTDKAVTLRLVLVALRQFGETTFSTTARNGSASSTSATGRAVARLEMRASDGRMLGADEVQVDDATKSDPMKEPDRSNTLTCRSLPRASRSPAVVPPGRCRSAPAVTMAQGFGGLKEQLLTPSLAASPSAGSSSSCTITATSAPAPARRAATSIRGSRSPTGGVSSPTWSHSTT